MPKSRAKPQYAAIPMRALVDLTAEQRPERKPDEKFTGTHLALLAIIAAHDRLSLHRNSGAGCFLSNKQLAVRCGLSYARTSTMLNQLESWGYIVRAALDRDARRKTARVIYNEQDGEAFKAFRDADLVCIDANDRKENVSPDANNPANLVCTSANELNKILCTDRDKSVKNQKENYANSITFTSPQYITRRGEIDSVKQGNRFSEGARPKPRRAVEKLNLLWERMYPPADTAALLRQIDRDGAQEPLWDPKLFTALNNVVTDATDEGLREHARAIIESRADPDMYENWMVQNGHVPPHITQ